MEFPIPFTKMSGTGNDFILIDNRNGTIRKDEMSHLARRVCRRQFSVGADGLILIENSDQADFRWHFYNADGSEAEMCGNGARCAARFAFSRDIAPASMKFETIAGLISAEMSGLSVKIRLTPPSDIIMARSIDVAGQQVEVHSINTGVPHAVYFVDDNSKSPVVEMGRLIRHHKLFEPAGTNVNFVQLPKEELYVRTYERGVENETQACGTGAVASALIAALHGHVTSPVKVRTSGGEQLIIHFTLLDVDPGLQQGIVAVQHEQRISEVFLEGPASFIYEGKILPEAL
ncbi:MAG: diaminopimelate epimerase [Proteobacteria bacterium]|nr:diaminopimelate epimerase [Pseudomonadota bacterium]MBU1737510.1 diaminopimelate epimerase [Pseudomonadota bacterium]